MSEEFIFHEEKKKNIDAIITDYKEELEVFEVVREKVKELADAGYIFRGTPRRWLVLVFMFIAIFARAMLLASTIGIEKVIWRAFDSCPGESTFVSRSFTHISIIVWFVPFAFIACKVGILWVTYINIGLLIFASFIRMNYSDSSFTMIIFVGVCFRFLCTCCLHSSFGLHNQTSGPRSTNYVLLQTSIRNIGYYRHYCSWAHTPEI